MRVIALLSLFLVGAHGFGRLLMHVHAHERIGTKRLDLSDLRREGVGIASMVACPEQSSVGSDGDVMD
jgi:hypothetical protein